MRNKHLISIHDLSRDEVMDLLKLAKKMKKYPDRYRTGLAGKTLGMIFQKSSTRTRVSFEVGMYQLGGYALFLSSNDLQLGRGETISDTAKVLGRYLDGIMARTYAHQDVLDLAKYSGVPVINGLTDLLHPCQVLADYLTIYERHEDDMAGRKLVYVGDGNNMAHSLMFGGAKVGMHVTIICPKGYEPDEKIVAMAREDAKETGIEIVVTHDVAAVAGADVVYTDVWASMGQEKEAAERKKIFAPYQVNAALMAKAKPNAYFMHCLPAHRGDEVTDEVADSANSIIFDEAENRLHIQKAIMFELMKD